MQLLKNKKTLLFIFLLILLGFLRDFFFMQTNIIMHNKWYNSNDKFHPLLQFITNFDYWTLYYAKWFFTFLFIGLYFFLTLLCTKSIFDQRLLNQLIKMLYFSLIMLAAISITLGWIFNDLEQGYLFSRMFVGILHSPIPLMLIIPFGFYYNSTKK